MLHQGWEVGTNNTPFPIFMRTRLIHHKRSLVPRNSVIPPHGEYAIFLPTRIAPLYAHRYKLLYEGLGSQRWYFQPLRYPILQGTLPPISGILFYVYPWKSKKVNGKKRYIQHQLIESIRTPSVPRQQIVLNLGHLCLSEEKWKAFANCIEGFLTNQKSLMVFNLIKV